MHSVCRLVSNVGLVVGDVRSMGIHSVLKVCTITEVLFP